MTDKELIQELRSKAEVEGAGSTRRLLELAARALEQRQWVSVKERLPELKRYDEDGDTWLMSSPVLVATAKGLTIGYYEDDLDPKFKPGWNDREHGERIRVTHWMELPERPKK